MKAFSFLFLAFALAASAEAHDSWLEPRDFATATGKPVPVIFYVGHHGEQSPATLSTRPAWLLSMRDLSPAGTRDLLKLARFRPQEGLPLPGIGTHLVALDTADFVNLAEPEQFGSYLAEEGLAGAEASWRRSPVSGRKVREAYRRHAKTLIQVGSGPAAVRGPVTTRLGQRLEIVPSSNPFALRPGARVEAAIWFKGKPLQGALVTLGSLDRPTDEPLAARSGAGGRVSFPRPGSGRWMMNVVWSERSSEPGADFQTSFSSLTFGVRPTR